MLTKVLHGAKFATTIDYKIPSPLKFSIGHPHIAAIMKNVQIFSIFAVLGLSIPVSKRQSGCDITTFQQTESSNNLIESAFMDVVFSCYNTFPLSNTTGGIVFDIPETQVQGIDRGNSSASGSQNNLVVPIGSFSGQPTYTFDNSQNKFMLIPPSGGNELAATLTSCTSEQQTAEENLFHSRMNVYTNLIYQCYNVFPVSGSGGIVIVDEVVVAINLGTGYDDPRYNNVNIPIGSTVGPGPLNIGTNSAGQPIVIGPNDAGFQGFPGFPGQPSLPSNAGPSQSYTQDPITSGSALYPSGSIVNISVAVNAGVSISVANSNGGSNVMTTPSASTTTPSASTTTPSGTTVPTTTTTGMPPTASSCQAQGLVLNAAGICVTAANGGNTAASCQAQGLVLNAAGLCVTANTAASCQAQGLVLNAAGLCVSAANGANTAASCQAQGLVLNAAGLCVSAANGANTAASCQAQGLVLNAAGNCVTAANGANTAASCQAQGLTLSAAGLCV